METQKKTKLVYGVGLMDADYVVQEKISVVGENGKKKQKLLWRCPFYSRWISMLKRCYSARHQENKPTYKGCSVCEEWLTFSNFKAWMETQDWEGKALDKDLLFQGNKVYSPETCVFVDHKVNNFLTERNACRGQWMIGVWWREKLNKFLAQCDGGEGKSKHLGYFNTEKEAHLAWLKRKQEVARQIAAEQTDPRVAKALIERYENYESQDNGAPEV